MSVRRIGMALLVAVLGRTADSAVDVRQVMKPARDVRGDENVRVMQPADTADWVWMPGHDVYGISALGADMAARAKSGDVPGQFFRFRNDFSSDGAPLRLDVTADERFVLLLDGRPIARGPQRGLVERWYYQSYEITGLTPGSHRLEAVCWQLLSAAPAAQLSFRGGFLLKAEGAYDARLTTGKGAWRVAPLVGTVMTGRGTSGAFGVGNQCRVVGTGILNEEPASGGWQKAVVVRRGIDGAHWWERQPSWMLFPADRPDQTYDVKTPGRVVNAVCDLTKPLMVPAHSERDLWWDLGDYFCAYPELEASGGKGATVSWGWAESLYDGAGAKGNRNEWKGKDFSRAFTDAFVADGRPDAVFTTPWWRCGRWCRVTVKTADEPLVIRRVALGESRYPLAAVADFACDDPSVEAVFRLSRRTMESCLHEMLFDCPYYEQQMYAGDTRIQLQILNALTSDARPARFAMGVFDWARRDGGFVPMQFPSRAMQESCTYTMCWILMLGDHLFWRNDLPQIRARMPGVRNALDGLARYENAEGLLEDLPGWSFMDWVKDWAKERPDFPTGCAPCGEPGQGVSALNNLLYLLAIQSAATVEEALGESELAARARRKAMRLKDTLRTRFWSEERGLLADTEAKDRFSEHAQALGILSGVLSGARRDSALAALVAGREGLAPVSTYFSYYLFEALTQCGRADVVLERMGAWNDFIAWGGRTAFETQHIDSRSDCHAWSASPIYFLQSAIAGIRPAAPCFRRVRVAPQPGRLKRIRAKSPTPKGEVVVDLTFRDGTADGSVVLPPGLEGEFVWNGVTSPLKAGRNTVASAGSRDRESGTAFADEALRPFLESGEIPGAITVFHRDGREEVACLGYANVEERRPMAMDAIFQQCSQTKGFCGVSAAMLVEDGRLDLDDPVSKYLPEFGTLWVEAESSNGVRRLSKATRALTVKMCLTHMGGLPFELPNWMQMGGWSRRMPLRSVAATAAAVPLAFEPGEKVQYSNVGMDVVAAIVEVIAGQRWETFLGQRLFAPLGMDDTTFWPTDEQLKRKIDLYRVQPGHKARRIDQMDAMQKPWNDDRVFPSAGAGLWTTARDQLKFYKMLMNLGQGANGARILREETVKQLLSVSQRTKGICDEGYSLGLVAPWTDGDDQFFGHGGAWVSQCLVNWHRKELRLLAVQYDGGYYIRDVVARAAERFFRHRVDDSGVNAYTGRMK